MLSRASHDHKPHLHAFQLAVDLLHNKLQINNKLYKYKFMEKSQLTTQIHKFLTILTY